MKTVEQLAQATDPLRIRLAGMVRRFVVSIAGASSRWQLAGVKMPSGQEARNAEVFAGIGFFARPPAGGSPEAVAVMVGDANTPIVVAVRDEKTRAAVAGALGLDESMMFNTKAVLLIKGDGTLEARSVGGTAHALATKADVQALRDWCAGMAYGGSGSVIPVGGAAPPNPSGTTKFKAE